MKAVVVSIEVSDVLFLDKIVGRDANGLFQINLGGVVIPTGHVLRVSVVRKHIRSKLLTNKSK